MNSTLQQVLAESRSYQLTLRQGRQMVCNKVHSHDLVLLTESDEETKRTYYRALTDLIAAFEPSSDWVLTGGLAVPASTKQFTRVHSAVHVGTTTLHLPTLIENALRKEFILFHRDYSFKIGGGYKNDIYKPVTIEELRQRKLPKNLRFVRISDERGKMHPHNNLMDYIDIYLEDIIAGSLTSNDDPRKGPQKDSTYYEGLQHTTALGEIHIVNLQFLHRLKTYLHTRKADARHAYDIKAIEAFQTNKS